MRHHLNTLVVLGLLGIAGCTDPVLEQRVADLETDVAELKTEVEELKSRPEARAPTARRPRPGAASAEEEEKATELLRAANSDVQDMKFDDAKAKLEELCGTYPSTRACRSSKRLESEMAVIGRDAGEIEVEKWFTDSANMSDGKATLLIFFETWCPHCRREVPVLQKTYETYNGQGLNVVALTKVTKSSTDEGVEEFIAESNLTYPVGKEDGTAMSENFGVRGIPAAAVVKDGKIVWRGHPARLTDDMYKAWLEL